MACPSVSVAETDSFTEVLVDGLRENMVDFVIGLPCSGFAAAQARCMDDQSMLYIGVANEGTGFGLCAGAWLGGKRPAAVVENFGLTLVAGHQLCRCEHHIVRPSPNAVFAVVKRGPRCDGHDHSFEHLAALLAVCRRSACRAASPLDRVVPVKEYSLVAIDDDAPGFWVAVHHCASTEDLPVELLTAPRPQSLVLDELLKPLPGNVPRSGGSLA